MFCKGNVKKELQRVDNKYVKSQHKYTVFQEVNLMSVWNYKQLTPYMAAKRTTLLTPQELFEFTERNLNFLVTKLMETPYRNEIDIKYIQKLDALNLEDALLTHFTNSCLKAANMSPKNIKKFVMEYMKKYEIDALKNLVKVIHAKINPADAFKYIIPVGKFDKTRCETILEKVKNIDDLIDMIIDTEYFFIIKKNQSIVEDTGLLFVLESELNKFYYEQLWKTVLTISGQDGRIIRDFIGLEITSMNFKVLLRYQLAGFQKDTIVNYLIIIPEIFDKPILDKVTQSKSIAEIMFTLRDTSKDLNYDYQYMFRDLIEEYSESKSISRLDYVLDKSILRSSYLMIKRYTPYYNVASLIAYINAKWYEFRNLRAIIHGISNELSPSQIKNELIVVDQK